MQRSCLRIRPGR